MLQSDSQMEMGLNEELPARNLLDELSVDSNDESGSSPELDTAAPDSVEETVEKEELNKVQNLETLLGPIVVENGESCELLLR